MHTKDELIERKKVVRDFLLDIVNLIKKYGDDSIFLDIPGVVSYVEGFQMLEKIESCLINTLSQLNDEIEHLEKYS